MKTTSQVELYTNNSAMKAGVVFYPAKQLPFFPIDTAIQPDNAHPIPHAEIAKRIADGSFTVLGNMPSDFAQKISKAINDSITMKPVRKKHFLERI